MPGAEPKVHKGTMMDPNQTNRFWRAQIAKEQRVYGDGSAQHQQAFNILSHATQNVPARVDHLMGAGAAVRAPEDEEAEAPVALLSKTQKLDPETASVAGSVRSQARSGAGSKAGSKAGSSVEIMNRLARLEADLKAERERRVKAESELRDLMVKEE